jgi:carboxypeptidase family protein
MNDPKIFYPDFLPNQILTNTQLNDLRNYLDVQNLKTRMRLVGAGIVCGLNFNFNKALKEIRLCNGYGLTSAGHLIEFPVDKLLIEQPEKIFTKKAVYTDPDQDDNDKPNYKLWWTSEAIHTQIELFELKEDNDEGDALDVSDFEDKVLLLYLEKKGVDLNSCLVTECDNKGLNINLEVKVLLAPKIHFAGMDTGIKPVLNSFKIPRLHTELNFSDADSSDKINSAYGRIIQFSKDSLANKIKTLLDSNPLCRDIGYYEALIIKYKSDLDALIAAKNINQYHYDHLNDLADAYNELVLALSRYKQNCFDERDYPRHLILGLSNGTHLYRHHFKPAPIVNVIEHEQKYIKKLVLRVLLIMDKFKLPVSSLINITPDNTRLHPLGQRAVPYYYDEPGLNDASIWKPFDRYEFDEQWSYSLHNPSKAGNYFRTDYSNSSFIRVEGHLGENCKTVTDNLEQLKKIHNVEFDVFVTHLNKPLINPTVMNDLYQAQASLTNLYSELRKLINKIIRKPEIANNIVLEFQQQRSRIVAYQNLIYENNKKWAENNCSIVPQCNLTELQTQYLEYRAELIAILNRFQSLVMNFSTSDLLLPVIIIAKDKKTKADNQENANPVRQSLIYIANILLERIRMILKTFFYKDICAFNYEIFIIEYKEIYADFMAFNLLHSEYLRLSRKNSILNIPPGLDEGIPDYLFGHASIVIDKLAVLFALYKKYHTIYSNVLFKTFSSYVTGLEHLAGVQRCGTFVLVCDDNGTIVADFSLSCRLACCCDIDMSSLCLPVIAKTDYSIARIELDEGGYKPVTTIINLLNNDYDTNLNFQADLIVPVDEIAPLDNNEKEIEKISDKTGILAEKISIDNNKESKADLIASLLEVEAGKEFKSNNFKEKFPILSGKVTEEAKMVLLERDKVAIVEYETWLLNSIEKLSEKKNKSVEEIRVNIPIREFFPIRKILTISYLDVETELGGTIKPLEESPGYVQYDHPAPYPYMVDRFRYEISWQDGDCIQTDHAYGLIFHWPIEPGTGKITGTVFTQSKIKKSPIENAIVINDNNGFIYNTNNEGRFSFSDLQPDIYTLRVFKQGYQKETRVIEVDKGETDNIEIELFPLNPGSIKGRVVMRSASGELIPVKGADVLNTNINMAISTLDDGTFIFDDLQPAIYTLKVVMPGYKNEIRTIELEYNEVDEIEIELEPVKSYKIVGFAQLVRILRLANSPPVEVTAPLPGVTVILNENGVSVLTDNEGRFEFNVLVPRTYMLSATFSFVSKPAEVVVTNGDPDQTYIKFYPGDFWAVVEATTNHIKVLPPTTGSGSSTLVEVSGDLSATPDSTPVPEITIIGGTTGLTSEGVTTKNIRNILNSGEVKLIAADIADKNPNLVAAVEEFAGVALIGADSGVSNIDATYKEVAANLKNAIDIAPEEDKASYGKLLETTSKIYLDSLATRSATDVTPETKIAVSKVVAIVNDANLDLTKFKQNWNGELLATDGNVSSALTISNLIQ